MRRHHGVIEHLHQVGRPAEASERLEEKASNTPLRLSRQKRFQTLFQRPDSAGRARHVILWTVK
jgi:hypothetical protein